MLYLLVYLGGAAFTGFLTGFCCRKQWNEGPGPFIAMMFWPFGFPVMAGMLGREWRDSRVERRRIEERDRRHREQQLAAEKQKWLEAPIP